MSEWSHARFLADDAAVDRLLDAGRVGEAVTAARKMVQTARAAGEKAYDGAVYDLALTHFKLGRSLKTAGAARSSLEPLDEALRRFQKLADIGNAPAAHMLARCASTRADSLTALGRFGEAAQAYEQAIRQLQGLGDIRAVAVTRAQLGTLRLWQQRYKEALKTFDETRRAFADLGDIGSVAVAWHQIGRTHQEVGDYESAEDAYRESLKIRVEQTHRSGEAAILNQLGLLFARQGRLEDAVAPLGKAAAIYQELDDLANEGRARGSLATQLIELKRYDEARHKLDRAFECLGSHGSGAERSKIFGILHQLESKLGKEEAAKVARNRAVQEYLAYRRDGGENQSPVTKVAADVHRVLSQGDAAQAETMADMMARTLEELELTSQVRSLVTALQAILSGSRDLALAEDPALDYAAAAEILLLLERLD